MDRLAVEEFWESFRQACGVEADQHGAFAFGDSAGMADELAGLVVHGLKRATAGLLADYQHDDEPLPQPGEYAVVVNGRGLPVAVVRTTQVEVKPMREVDAAFAWDEGEGEGDRSLAYWLDAHHRFFARRCAQLGVAFSDDLLTVFERFELDWPRAPDSGH